MNTISLIMPVWNGAAYLQETLASARAQEFDGSLEILVVDDGSTDASPGIARECGCRVMPRPHGGIAAACNFGLAQAAGDFVLFLDQDDMLLPGALAAFLEGIAAHDACEGMARDFLSPDLSLAERQKLAPRPEPYYGLLTGSCLIRRETALANGPFNETYHAGQAVDWLLRLRGTASFGRLPRETVLRRLHARNTSRVKRAEQWRDYGSLLRAKLAGGKPRA